MTEEQTTTVTGGRPPSLPVASGRPDGAEPGPGVYRDVPPADYFAWPYVSASVIGEMARSPQNAIWAMHNPSPTTPAMRIGRAFHSAALEPAVHGDRYVTGGSCSAAIKTGERAGLPCGSAGSVRSGGEWLCKTHAKGRTLDPDDGREVIAPDDAAAIADMAAAVRRHRWARKALALDGLAEVSVVFDDPETGVRCRIRPDWLTVAPNYQLVVDIKTTEDGSRDAFSRGVERYGYHTRAAFYLRGLRAAGYAPRGYVLLTVEKSPPYVVRPYLLDAVALTVGEANVFRLLADLARCRSTGAWDAAEADLQTIELPRWAVPREYRADGSGGAFDLESL